MITNQHDSITKQTLCLPVSMQYVKFFFPMVVFSGWFTLAILSKKIQETWDLYVALNHQSCYRDRHIKLVILKS